MSDFVKVKSQWRWYPENKEQDETEKEVAVNTDHIVAIEPVKHGEGSMLILSNGTVVGIKQGVEEAAQTLNMRAALARM